MSRNFTTSFEKRLQDLERNFQNMHRMGKVSDVKFDKEKKRWYAKIEDGEGDDAFKSDWLPWQSFSHPTIKASVPPRKGQYVDMHSPGGNPEMAVARPYHYNPDNPSPHDKEDEVFFQVTAPDEKKNEGEGGNGQSGSGSSDASSGSDASSQESEEKKAEQQLKVKMTKDGLTAWIGKTKLEMTAKGFVLTHDKNTITLNAETIKSSMEDGKSTHALTKDQVEGKVGDGAKHTITKENVKTDVDGTALTIKSGESKFESGSLKHDDRNIGKSHTHRGVMPGGGITGDPNP